jgi:hypothetical protein
MHVTAFLLHAAWAVEHVFVKRRHTFIPFTQAKGFLAHHL